VDFNHLAGVIDPVSGVMQIYRNGQLMASGATGGPLVANSSPLTIGRVDIYQFLGIIDEVSVFNRALSASEVASIYNAAGAGKSLALEVANVAPTPILSGFTTNLATQVVDYTFSGTDPSPVDQAAGFQYRIEWGDGMHQAVAQAAGNAAGTRLSHRYAAPGTYTATLTAFDKDGDSSSTTRTITVLAVTSGNMQKVIDQQGKITLHATTDAEAQAVVTAVNGLSAQTSFKTITLSLGSGTYSGTTASPKANITLVIIGSGGTTTIVGHSPSLNVTEGTVIVSDLTLTNATDAPTIHVSNGNLTLRNVVIEESNAADQAAVLITGGTVDLGRPDDPGGNRFNTNGLGKLIRHTGGNAVSAAGNTFQTDGATLTSPYRIEDGIDHAVDTGAGGTVSFVLGNTYVTVSGGSIQRGIDAVAEDGTVNVEAGSYTNYDVGSKRLTLRFDNGPTLSQEPNAQDPSLRDLVITGTAAADQIQVTQGGASIQAQVRGVPNGRFNPTGQLVIHGGAGDDAISVASGIDLTAWLYGDAGNDALSGGGGTNVLLGGSGDDQLIGSQGRDLLIGGLGADLLNGNDGDDLLIAGLTAFDDDATALAAILAEWTSARSYAERVANLRNTLIGSGPDATVFDDGAPDQLRGASGKDWFFANLSGGILDAVNNQDGSELVEELTSDI
jgi:PKD repeat protein